MSPVRAMDWPEVTVTPQPSGDVCVRFFAPESKFGPVVVRLSAHAAAVLACDIERSQRDPQFARDYRMAGTPDE